MNKGKILSILKQFFFPIAVVAFILVFSPLFLIPKIVQINKIKSDITQQEKKISQLTQKSSDLQSLSETELFETTSLLLEALPPKKDFYKILTLTKKIFADNSAILKTYNFSPGKISTESGQSKTNDSDSNKMFMQISFSSSYDNFGNLLASFSKSLPLMEVDSIKFDSLTSSASATLPDLEGVMRVKSYYSPLPKTMGELLSPLPKISNKDTALIDELKTYQRYQPEEISGASQESVVVGKENPFP